MLTGGFQRRLELDKESNQRERRGARWMKALDPTISQTDQGEFQLEGVFFLIKHNRRC